MQNYEYLTQLEDYLQVSTKLRSTDVNFPSLKLSLETKGYLKLFEILELIRFIHSIDASKVVDFPTPEKILELVNPKIDAESMQKLTDAWTNTFTRISASSSMIRQSKTSIAVRMSVLALDNKI